MTNVSYTIRNYQPDDFDSLVRLYREVENLEPGGRPVSPSAVVETMSRPDYSPQRDLFVVETNGSLVGYMDMVPELGIGRVILDVWLSPEHRRKGLAVKLLNYAMRHAGELGAGIVQVNVMEGNTAARTALSRLGFRCVRQFLEFKLDMAALCQTEAEQADRECCHLGCGEEDTLARIQNRCFAGSWGYNPNTVETVTYRTSLSDCSPEDVLLIGEGDEVAGYCWTTVTGGGGAAGGEREGRIYMLGVAPDYEGRGIGKRLLLAGLAHLSRKGIRLAGVTADSENQAACALYRSVGFEVRAKSLWYEKAVAQDTEAS